MTQPFDDYITAYAQALSVVAASPHPPLEPILDVLLARDNLQAQLEVSPNLASHQLSHIAKLDNRLHHLANAIANREGIAQCRQSRQPPQSAWWWYLESSPSPPPPQPWWAKYDWVWNAGTVACLVVSTTFLTQTVKAFSAAQGFDFLGALSTIGQGAGLVLVAGGALTDRGKKVVEEGLSRFEFPPYLHAEITFAGALVLLGVSYGINRNLPLVGELYYQQGRAQQAENRWSEAQDSYDRALNFIPDDPRITVATGSIYEALGEFERAIAEYEKGVLFGDPAAMNALGRALVWQDWTRRDWQTKINDDTAQRAELLYERASKLVTQTEGDSDLTALQAEIRINQGVLDWARASWDVDAGLLDRSWLFDNAMALEASIAEKRRSRYETWTFRGKCYAQLSLILRFALEEVVPGIDPNVAYRQFDEACFDLMQGDRAALIYDTRVVSTALNLKSVRAFFQNLQNNGNPVKISNSAQIQQLQQQLSAQIEQNLEALFAIEEDVTLRVFVNGDAQIVQYYAYDENSASLAYATPIDSLWWAQRDRIATTAPLADFRVTFTPQGTFEVTPWSAVASHVESTHRSILKSNLFEQLDRNTPKRLSVSGAWGMGEISIFTPSLLYRVGLTAEGNVADIEPLNPEAKARFEETSLARLDRAKDAQVSLSYFTVEFKANDVFRIEDEPIE
jgi:tetratricopeptide (TPR) repeat protein